METWKSIKGYEGLYEVSSLGRVRSLDRSVKDIQGKPKIRNLKGRILRQSSVPNRYPVVVLSKNGKLKSREIHRLVIETFIGPCPEGMECCHWDGDRRNNCLSNLRWDTRKENHRDKVRHGTRVIGRDHHQFGKYNCFSAKLSREQVEEIRQLCRNGIRQRVLAHKFGISEAAISLLINNKTWSHSE